MNRYYYFVDLRILAIVWPTGRAEFRDEAGRLCFCRTAYYKDQKKADCNLRSKGWLELNLGRLPLRKSNGVEVSNEIKIPAGNKNGGNGV